MQKWDMLIISPYEGSLHIESTNAQEIKDLAEIVLREAKSYFSYMEGPSKIDIKIDSVSKKGHAIYIKFAPRTDSIRDVWKIFDKDFKYFLLNIVISRNWHPYPGDGNGESFIRYNE